jgi:S-adenosylmethionine hydrolase
MTDSLAYLPDDAVVTARSSIERREDMTSRDGSGRVLVGPDNGLMSSWAASGAHQSRSSPDVILGPVVASFHARDVLCPRPRTRRSRSSAGVRPSSLVSLVVVRRSSREDRCR